MNFQELTSKLQDSPMELNTYKSGQHYNRALGHLTFMPTTLAQAKNQVRHIKNESYDNLLMCGKWFPIEEFLNNNGFTGQYELTKSKTFCRLVNIQDYCSALKKQFNF
jgi:hypothetical protein